MTPSRSWTHEGELFFCEERVQIRSLDSSELIELHYCIWVCTEDW